MSYSDVGLDVYCVLWRTDKFIPYNLVDVFYTSVKAEQCIEEMKKNSHLKDEDFWIMKRRVR